MLCVSIAERLETVEVVAQARTPTRSRGERERPLGLLRRHEEPPPVTRHLENAPTSRRLGVASALPARTLSGIREQWRGL
jgi:hypothetical protein